MKTVNVTVTIQMDIRENGDQTAQVGQVLDLINKTVGMSEFESQPQILSNNFEVEEQQTDEEE